MTQRLTQSYLLERDQGIHAWGTDTFKLALFDANAALSELTTAYSASHEVVGTGYTAAGFALALTATYPKIVNGQSVIALSTVTANPASFNFRYGLIYNASKANRSVAVIDFGQTKSAVSSFTYSGLTLKSAAAA